MLIPVRSSSREQSPLYWNDLGGRLAISDSQQGDGAMRLAAAIHRAAGIEQHQPVAILQPGDVAVAEDDDAGCGKFDASVAEIALAVIQNVNHPDLAAAYDQCPGERQLHLNLLLLDIPLYRLDGRIGAELVENRQRREVARVEDQLDILEVAQHRVGQAGAALGNMRIGNHAD